MAHPALSHTHASLFIISPAHVCVCVCFFIYPDMAARCIVGDLSPKEKVTG